jgi:hypothetical protein
MRTCFTLIIVTGLCTAAVADPPPPRSPYAALRAPTPTKAHDQAHGLTRFPLPRMPMFPQLPTPPFGIMVVGKQLHIATGSSAFGILRMARPGGAATRLLSGFRSIASSPVFWRGRVFFHTLKAIWSVNAQGGAPRREWSLPDTLSLYVHGKRLYRTVFRGRVIQELIYGKPKPRRIVRLPESPDPLAFDGRDIYAVQSRRGRVLRIDPRGRVKTVARGQRKVVSVVVLGEHVYWSLESKGAPVRRRRKSGRGRVEVIAKGQVNAEYLTAHEGAVYWRSWAGGRGKHQLMRYAPAKKELTAAVTGLYAPAGFAFDDTYVYVSDKGTGSIVRKRRPAAAPLKRP